MLALSLLNLLEVHLVACLHFLGGLGLVNAEFDVWRLVVTSIGSFQCQVVGRVVRLAMSNLPTVDMAALATIVSN